MEKLRLLDEMEKKEEEEKNKPVAKSFASRLEGGNEKITFVNENYNEYKEKRNDRFERN
jgi:hypothetical protein